MKEETENKKSAAANYIISFYDNVQALNDVYSTYLCVMTEIKSQFPDPEKAADEYKEQIKQHIQNIRFVLHKAYIQYVTIMDSLKIKKSKKITEDYKQIKDVYMITTDIIESFVLEMNKTLVNHIIQDLLTTSQQLIQSMFNNAPTE